MFRLGREKKSQLKSRRAQQRRRPTHAQTPGKQPREYPGQKHMRNHLNFKAAKYPYALIRSDQQDSQDAWRIEIGRLQLCVNGAPAVGVGIPEWQLAASERFSGECRVGQMVQRKVPWDKNITVEQNGAVGQERENEKQDVWRNLGQSLHQRKTRFRSSWTRGRNRKNI